MMGMDSPAQFMSEHLSIITPYIRYMEISEHMLFCVWWSMQVLLGWEENRKRTPVALVSFWLFSAVPA